MAKYVRVSTIAFRGPEFGDGKTYSARTRDLMAKQLELAAQAKPDLVVFPEFCNVQAVNWGPKGERLPELAETIPGPTTDRMAEIAAKHRMYVAVSIPERDGKRFYNTTAYLDRQGRVIG